MNTRIVTRNDDGTVTLSAPVELIGVVEGKDGRIHVVAQPPPPDTIVYPRTMILVREISNDVP